MFGVSSPGLERNGQRVLKSYGKLCLTDLMSKSLWEYKRKDRVFSMLGNKVIPSCPYFLINDILDPCHLGLCPLHKMSVPRLHNGLT